LHHLCHGQITELLADPDDLIHGSFKLPHGLNLSPVDWNQLGILQAQRHGLLSLLAGQQRIGAAFHHRAVGVLDGEKLFGERAVPQFAQAG